MFVKKLVKKTKKKLFSHTKKAYRKIKFFLRGFTIIELIVVITIIGTLTSIIMVSVSSYMGKSKDSRIKAEASEISKGAAMHYTNNSTFTGYQIPSSFVPISTGSDYVFSTDGASAVVYVKLVTSNNYWCVDSTGAKTQIENPPNAGTYVCVSGSGGGGPLCNNNGLCNAPDENNANCPADCFCGDGICRFGDEDSSSCPADCPPSFACGDALVDSRDSKTYSTVSIGSQCWMAENLDYNSGCAQVTWVNFTDVGWCGYYTGGPFPDEGLLYQWSAAMAGSVTENAQGVCPSGWHVPTHYDYTTLERAVCSSGTCATDFPYDTTTTSWRGTDEGTKLKLGGSSGFNGLLAGLRNPDGEIGLRGAFGYFWSSSQIFSTDAWHRHGMGFINNNVYRGYYEKARALSVRCVKDLP